MPIYAYKCGSCGHAKDVLQKVSDAALTQCPSCGAQAFSKQITAAGFQLKGSGWYVTDFRNNSNSTGGGSPAPASDSGKQAESGSAKPSESPPSKSEGGPAAASGGCGGACACH